MVEPSWGWFALCGVSWLPGSLTPHPEAASILSLSCPMSAATVLFQLETLRNTIPPKKEETWN